MSRRRKSRERLRKSKNKMFAEKLSPILEELMSNNYSEIQYMKLGFVQGRLEDNSASTYRRNGKWEIMIDKRIMNSRKGVLRGLLCHEISHVIRMDKLKPSTRHKEMRLYRKKLHKYLDERNTDLDVILRGHGMDLLSYKMSEVSRGENGRTGLSLYEIKKLIGIL